MQYLDSKGIFFSDKCCYEFKKDIFFDIEKRSGLVNSFTGMRREEGGNRSGLNCIQQSHNGVHLNPLAPLKDDFMEEFIKRENIDVCELYKEPYNFNRSGCVACVYSLDLQEQLNKLYEIDKKTYWQSIHLWKPVYDEYIRLQYRLKYYPHERGKQLSIFDLIEEEKK